MGPQWLNELDPQQQQAVTHEGGPVIVLAGAGTGKTRVLTYRIAYLLDNGVLPQTIVALTFTNKAADTMRSRLEKLVGTPAQGVWMGTFHSLFARWLRMLLHGEPVSSRFIVYDQEDSLSLLRALLREQGISPKEAGRYRTIISRWKNQGLSPFAVKPQSHLEEKAFAIYQAYQQRLRLADALDFDDLLLEMDHLLVRDPTALAYLQARYQHILVDEYQDTNAIQYQVVARLAARHRQLFVVGDDAQSIYRFRGADIQNFRYLQRDFPDTKIIKLEKNYRSTPIILKLANEVLRHSHTLMAKELFTDRAEGPKPELLEDFSTDAEEAAFVARKIRELVMREHVPYREIGVLYRINAYSRALEERLRGERIPYRLVGTVSFYQREEVKHFLAYLRLVHNPCDDQALWRVVNIPPRGIGEVTMDKWHRKAIHLGLSLWESLEAVAAELGTAQRRALLEFQGFLEQMRAAVQNLSLPDIAEQVLWHSGLERYYANDERAQERKENLQAAVEAVHAFYHDRPEDGLEGFLAHLALYTTDDEGQVKEEAVWLSSIHGVKGMEFDTVFLVGLNDGLLPHIRARDEGLEAEEEERRIFYVGLTRAARRLYLCRPLFTRQQGDMRSAIASPFIEELRKLLVEPKRRAGPLPNTMLTSTAPKPSRPSLSTPKVDASVSNGAFLSLKDLRPGLRVHHSHFGWGEVLVCEDNGAAGVVVVNFDRAGKKRLDLRYAKLCTT